MPSFLARSDRGIHFLQPAVNKVPYRNRPGELAITYWISAGLLSAISTSELNNLGGAAYGLTGVDEARKAAA
jgi:hypothetical protein